MRQTATRAEIDAFERRIRALIAEGYAVPFAVRQAYREYPVMRILFGELIDQIRAEAERGAAGHHGSPVYAVLDAR